jgi:hypothetical protein
MEVTYLIEHFEIMRTPLVLLLVAWVRTGAKLYLTSTDPPYPVLSVIPISTAEYLGHPIDDTLKLSAFPAIDNAPFMPREGKPDS